MHKRNILHYFSFKNANLEIENTNIGAYLVTVFSFLKLWPAWIIVSSQRFISTKNPIWIYNEYFFLIIRNMTMIWSRIPFSNHNWYACYLLCSVKLVNNSLFKSLFLLTYLRYMWAVTVQSEDIIVYSSKCKVKMPDLFKIGENIQCKFTKESHII